MTRLYVLDVPENQGVARVAAEQADVSATRRGPYFVFEAEGPIVVDRRATGVRHAVWYSSVGALGRSRVVQHDKDALRVEGA